MLYTIHTIRREAKSRFRSPPAWTKLHPTPRSIRSPFSPSAQSRGRDVGRDAVRCMGHLARCPKQWGSWLVSSIVRYQRADMPCRTAMCFMVHKSRILTMMICICTGRALCGRFTCHISTSCCWTACTYTSLTLGLGLGRLSGRHRPKLCSRHPHKQISPLGRLSDMAVFRLPPLQQSLCGI